MKRKSKGKILWYALVILILPAALAALWQVDIAEAGDWLNPQVRIWDASNNRNTGLFEAYDPRFYGGVNVSVGDADGDKRGEIYTGAGVGGGPHVRGFFPDGRPTGFSFFPFHSDFRGGVNVDMGDFDGDKKDDIVMSQASLGQAWVKVYKADAAKTILTYFMAYADTFEGGASVALGDLNGDGKDEVITASGLGSPGHVRAFDQNGNWNGVSIYPFESFFRGGAMVRAGDVDKDGKDEIIVSKMSQGPGQVKVYDHDGRTVLGNFDAYGGQVGAKVAVGDVDKDGEDEVITGAGSGGGPHVRGMEDWGYPLGLNFMAYSEDFRGGVNVAAGDLNGDGRAEVVTGPSRRIWEGRSDIKYIEVDISEQKLTTWYMGQKVREMRVSTGISRYPTPIGDFAVRDKVRSQRMAFEYGPGHPDNYDIPNVPHVMHFNGPFALHGAFWHNNFGTPMSHGCINLSLNDAAWLFDWADVGNPVYVRP